MTVNDALILAKETLFSVPDRDVDAAWIVSAVTNIKRNALHFEKDKELTQKQVETLKYILQRRKAREPLQYILGFVPFYNLILNTDKRALIPRDETALLVETAINIINKKDYKTVLDIGTGSGAIAIAIKKNVPETLVTASDISADALSLAKENACLNEVQVDFIKSDLFENLQNSKFDCILSNPPYIAAKDMEKLEKELSFEPQNALDGGSDGLDFYRDIISEVKNHLNKNGLLMFEIGFDQGDAVKTLLAKSGFVKSYVLKDYSALDRIVYTFYEG